MFGDARLRSEILLLGQCHVNDVIVIDGHKASLSQLSLCPLGLHCCFLGLVLSLVPNLVAHRWLMPCSFLTCLICKYDAVQCIFLQFMETWLCPLVLMIHVASASATCLCHMCQHNYLWDHGRI